MHFFQFLTKISVENSSCTCKNLKNRHNVGNCEGKRPMQFNTTTACYVNLPSNCSDLKESMTCPGEMLSTEACNFNERGEAENFNRSTLSNNETCGITDSSLNSNSSRNESDSRNIDNENVTKNSSDENPELTKLTTLSYHYTTPQNSSLKENVTNTHSNFGSFWQQYRKRFLKVLQRSKYELNDAPVRFFVRRQSFPRDSIIDLMYPEINSSAKEFKHCVLYSQCLSMENGKNSILNDTNKESCLDENVSEVCSNNTIRFEVM